jgi:protein-tyrosine phosphatase family protein
MIHRFLKVAPGIYRGSAPSPADVAHLHKKYNIKKIISLDEKSGERIDRSCKLLGIKQIKLYITDRKSILNLLHHNLKDLLERDGPTFIHCFHGKDRTGLVCAMFQVKYLGKSPEVAIAEAKKLGFGIGVHPSIISLYEKLIKSCRPVQDQNNADIVSNEREPFGDNRDSYLDEAQRGSFAPYLDQTKQAPVDALYNFVYDQSPTRENYQDYQNEKDKCDKDVVSEQVVPQVGIYDNDAGVSGFGPAANSGGFIYD